MNSGGEKKRADNRRDGSSDYLLKHLLIDFAETFNFNTMEFQLQ